MIRLAGRAATTGVATSYRQGVLLVLLGSVCASWIGLGVRMIDAASAWQILFFRSFGLMAFLLVAIAVRHRGPLLGAFRAAGRAALIGATGLVIAFFGSIAAIQEASVANAMFLLAAAPFMAAILARIVLKERVRLATWIAILGAFAGVTIMVAEGISFGFLWGNLAGLMAACGIATFVIALRYGHLTDMLPLAATAGALGMAVAAAVCLATGDGLMISAHDALLSLAMGIFQLGLALVLITVGSRTVPAAELALLNMAEVVLAPVWVWLAFGETAGFYTLIGGALVLAAIAGDAITGLRERRQSQATAAHPAT